MRYEISHRTTYAYDDNGADATGLSGTYASQLTGLGLAAGSDGSMVEVTNPVGEKSVQIRDGLGRVIRTVEGVSRDGMSAVIAGLNAMGWPQAGHQTDVAALDGGLQIARLWGYHMASRPSLPTAIGEFRRYVAGAVDGDLTVDLIEIAIAALFRLECGIDAEPTAPILGDARLLLDRLCGEQAQARERAAKAIWSS